jgi:hypothetical protein
MASFDFQEYLSQLDPQSSYQIESLTGGIVNLTSRATKTSALVRIYSSLSNCCIGPHDVAAELVEIPMGR